MRNFASYLRGLFIVILFTFPALYFIYPVNEPAFLTFIEFPIFLTLFTIVLIAIEIMIASMNNLTNAIMTEEQKERLAEKARIASENIWYKKLYHKLLDQKPIEAEGEIELDHNYDGIKELDNNLPPWWIYGFYLTIIFAVVYLVRYHILGADNQKAEYDKEMAIAKAAIEEYKKTAKDLVDASTVEFLSGEADLAAGKLIFDNNCVACHMADGGGGIGPNLTDDHWILGVVIKHIFNSVAEGGRDGKGMVAWKQSLKPIEIAQVSSYIMTLHGTTPANPKDPEGDIWVDENAPAQDAPATEVEQNEEPIQE